MDSIRAAGPLMAVPLFSSNAVAVRNEATVRFKFFENLEQDALGIDRTGSMRRHLEPA